MGWRRALTTVAVLMAGATALAVDTAPVHAATGVTGRVHDAANNPVAGASVTTSFSGTGVWTATSAADGSFQLGSDAQFPTGTFTVTASPIVGTGLAWATVSVTTAGGTFVDITVPAESTVRGTVRDPDGVPLASVKVRFGAPPGTVVPAGAGYVCPPREILAVTLPNGTYALPGLGALRCPVWFEPSAGSGLAAELYADTANLNQATPVQITTPGSNVTGIDAQLERAGSIVGRITDLDGAPAADVAISLAYANGDPFKGHGGATFTLADGTFAVPALKPGSYTLTHTGGGVAARAVPFQVTVVAGAVVDIGTLLAARLPVVTITDLGVTQMARGSRVNLRIVGTNFGPGALVDANVLETGQVFVSDMKVLSPTLITAAIELIPNPDFPFVSVGVSNLDGSFARCAQCIAIVDGPGLAQTITFDGPPPATVPAGASFPVSARATTGLDVTVAASGACTGIGANTATITATAVGTCTVTAQQAGNSAFAAAPTLTSTVAVTDAAPGAGAPTVVTASPTRVLDTRPDGPQLGYAGDKPVAGQTIEVEVAGAGGVPADAAAVALNVTGTEATLAGFVTVWPCDEERPLASSLNLTPGVTSPNAVVTKLGAGGKVCLFTQNGAHLLADVTGWFPAGAAYTAVQPQRLLDTRPDGPQAGYSGAKPVAGQTVELAVGGVAGVSADAAAVVLNVTGTDATSAGFVTVWPCGEERPLASSLNLTPGVTSPNAVVTKLGAGGKVCLFTQNGAHLLADLTGWFPAGAAYTAVQPRRVLDTRPDGPQAGYSGAKPAAGQTVTLTVDGVPGTARTVVLNVTGTEATAAGFVTVWPCDEERPLASSLNLTPGVTSPNAVITRLGAGNAVCLYTQNGAHLLADVTGFAG